MAEVAQRFKRGRKAVDPVERERINQQKFDRVMKWLNNTKKATVVRYKDKVIIGVVEDRKADLTILTDMDLAIWYTKATEQMGLQGVSFEEGLAASWPRSRHEDKSEANPSESMFEANAQEEFHEVGSVKETLGDPAKETIPTPPQAEPKPAAPAVDPATKMDSDDMF